MHTGPVGVVHEHAGPEGLARCMDLHDLAQGRGTMEQALAQVACDLLAVGISHDALYPAREVSIGVEQLKAVGGSATYRQIESIHGHDAFLLEVDQIQQILREFLSS